MLKRIFLPVLALTTTLFFAGCGGTATVETQVASEKREGIVKELGQGVYPQGTHRLEQDGKTIVLIEAANTQIDLSHFLNQEVTVQGNLKSGPEATLPVISVNSIVPKNKIEPFAVEVGTKKYVDSELGFSVAYPDIFTEYQTRSGVAFAEAGEKVLEILLFKNNEKKELAQWLLDSYGYTPDSLKKVSIVGLLGYQLQNTTGSVIYLSQNTQVYTLTWYDNNPDNRENNRKYYLQFVQSFTLADASNAVGDADNSKVGLALEDEFCGGIAALQCRTGLQCKLDGTYPDAGGICEPAASQATQTTQAISADQFPVNPKLPNITAGELQRGWYYGDAKQKKPGTPDTWIVVDADSRSAMWRRPDNAPTETAVVLPEANATKDELSANQNKVYNYLLKSIGTLAPEAPKIGSWSIVQLAFAAPNFVYITYNSGDQSRKLLLTYNLTNDSVQTESRAYFVPGTDADWLTSEGQDVAYGRELLVMNADGAVTKILENYSQYSNTKAGYQLQYPRSWYFRNATTIRTEFSDKPFPAGMVRITAELINGVNYTFGDLQKLDGKSVLYLELSDKQSLRLSSQPEHGGILQIMAQTFKKI